jgi:carbon dioxide concentrating mechanism protein CcmO
MHTELKPASTKTRLRLGSPANIGQGKRQRDKLRGAALGLVATESFPAIVGTADAMTKSADVFLVGYEKTGRGQCTAIVRGGVADVRMAVQAGVEAAQQFGEYVSSTVIPRPMPNLEAVLPICARLSELEAVGRGRGGRQAIGLLETRGFPAMVGAADAMTKSADIQLMAHETIGDGLCTILVRGSLPNVAIAIDAGIHEAERIGELNAVMIIPRPLDDLEDSLPQVDHAVEETETDQPLRIPLTLEDKPKELVPLEATQVEPLEAPLQRAEVEPQEAQALEVQPLDDAELS